MCNSTMHRPINGVVDPFSFSTIHFLRTCNRLMVPTDFRPYYNFIKDDNNIEYSANNSSSSKCLQELAKSTEQHCTDLNTIFPIGCPPKEISSSLPSLSATSPCSPLGFECLPDYHLPGQSRINAVDYPNFISRRQRGEKKPIPDEQKDEKYFERRKRNNEAAKKSRDARKIREDRIAFRAAILEQENAILRAQIVALREEMNTLRQMMGNRPAQISVNL